MYINTRVIFILCEFDIRRCNHLSVYRPKLTGMFLEPCSHHRSKELLLAIHQVDTVIVRNSFCFSFPLASLPHILLTFPHLMDMCGTVLTVDCRKVHRPLIAKYIVRSAVFVLSSSLKVYCITHTWATVRASHRVYTDRGPTNLSEVPQLCPDPNRRHHGNSGSKFAWTPGPSLPPIFGGPLERLSNNLVSKMDQKPWIGCHPRLCYARRPCTYPFADVPVLDWSFHLQSLWVS